MKRYILHHFPPSLAVSEYKLAWQRIHADDHIRHFSPSPTSLRAESFKYRKSSAEMHLEELLREWASVGRTGALLHPVHLVKGPMD